MTHFFKAKLAVFMPAVHIVPTAFELGTITRIHTIGQSIIVVVCPVSTILWLGLYTNSANTRFTYCAIRTINATAGAIYACSVGSRNGTVVTFITTVLVGIALRADSGRSASRAIIAGQASTIIITGTIVTSC